MKTVVLISTLTFLIIFGVIVLTTGMIEDITSLIRVPERDPDEAYPEEAVDRIRTSLTEERDNIQIQLESLSAKKLDREVEEKIDQQAHLRELIDERREVQGELTEERERSVQKLAKVYESMKPDKAAPILATMELDEVLSIMSRIKDRQAAKILTNMNPLMASEISSRMGQKGGKP